MLQNTENSPKAPVKLTETALHHYMMAQLQYYLVFIADVNKWVWEQAALEHHSSSDRT